ncbi:hypothetical protein HZA45_00080 [Candidatus Peregrinibacteria bacterium]|nr:hypothetical protein [Candidatus Peregrinibacteria bacterium]
MASRFLRTLALLELEERILNGAALVTLLGVFLPWISGEWLGGDTVTYSGLQFYTTFLGIIIVLLESFILSITIIPLTGRSGFLKKRHREITRLLASSQAMVLVVAALTVLMKVTFEFSRMEVRFGIYVTLIGSVIVTIYSFLKYQEQRRLEVHELFHHPEDQAVSIIDREESPLAAPAPPPPPPPPPLEHHHLHHG